MENDLIETICIENYFINRDDYTTDLDAFNWFRETNLTDEDNINYDIVSPNIVAGIYEEENYKAIYALLFTNFVQKLTSYITELETEKAKQLFAIYIKDLEKLYVKEECLENKKIK